MLKVCGGANIFAERERRFPLEADLGQHAEWQGIHTTGRNRRYPRVTLDEMARLMPEVILLPDEPYRFSAADHADFQALSQVPAVHNDRIYVIDGKIVCWYWSHMDESLETLPQLLRPAG